MGKRCYCCGVDTAAVYYVPIESSGKDTFENLFAGAWQSMHVLPGGPVGEIACRALHSGLSRRRIRVSAPVFLQGLDDRFMESAVTVGFAIACCMRWFATPVGAYIYTSVTCGADTHIATLETHVMHLLNTYHVKQCVPGVPTMLREWVSSEVPDIVVKEFFLRCLLWLLSTRGKQMWQLVTAAYDQIAPRHDADLERARELFGDRIS